MTTIASLLAEVIALQGSYSKDNTNEMRQRGDLIRRALPDALKPLVDSISNGGTAFSIEGSDGTGLKAKIPWVRIFAPNSSPRATQGWYLVFLFPIDGTGVHLSLNQGTNTPKNGAFAPRSVEFLENRVRDARVRLRESESIPTSLIEEIDLGDSGPLGAGYVRGNVYSRFYASDKLPADEELRSDLRSLAPLLQRLYSSDLSDGSQERGSYLLTWNPSNFEWSELSGYSQETLSGGKLAEEAAWSTVSGKILPGDRLFVMRLGAEPKGIVASGVASSRPFEGQHWDGTEGRLAQFVKCTWDFAVDPASHAPLGLSSLRQLDPEFGWTPQSSGVSIPPKTASQLETAWITHIRSLSSIARDAEEDTAPSYSLAELQEDAFSSADELEDMLALLKARLNLVIQGPPGVGKTYLAKRLAYALMGEKDDSRIEWIQFHQSYSYEEFVEGFRPTDGGGFKIRRGSFYRFCEFAKTRSPEPCVFVIDEINRGNLSRIFGELLSLIEEDKRGELSVRLAYSPEESRFSVPTNVYIIGLMNTADRSLAVVDYALRRRFRFVDLVPKFESPRFRSHLIRMGISYALADRICNCMIELNRTISEDTRSLGRGFEIGHSFFSPKTRVPDEKAWYERVVKFEIAPLLREYWFDAPDKAQFWSDKLMKGESA